MRQRAGKSRPFRQSSQSGFRLEEAVSSSPDGLFVVQPDLMKTTAEQAETRKISSMIGDAADTVLNPAYLSPTEERELAEQIDTAVEDELDGLAGLRVDDSVELEQARLAARTAAESKDIGETIGAATDYVLRPSYRTPEQIKLLQAEQEIQRARGEAFLDKVVAEKVAEASQPPDDSYWFPVEPHLNIVEAEVAGKGGVVLSAENVLELSENLDNSVEEEQKRLSMGVKTMKWLRGLLGFFGRKKEK